MGRRKQAGPSRPHFVIPLLIAVFSHAAVTVVMVLTVGGAACPATADAASVTATFVRPVSDATDGRPTTSGAIDSSGHDVKSAR